MSAWGIGKNDVSEETQAMKDRIAGKETENAGLRSQLMKREAELEEIKLSFNETLHKLSREADRALRLEHDLSRRSEDLKNEKIASQNTETALATANDKIKAQEYATRELEAIIDNLSRSVDSSAGHQARLEKEKSRLEARVRELENNTQQSSAYQTPKPRQIGRPRSSSLSSFRITTLEQELCDTRTLLAQKEKELYAVQDKMTRVQMDLVKSDNERLSEERLHKAEVAKLQCCLEEMEEELNFRKASHDDDSAGERERELLQRIEEDEAKISALEKLVAGSQSIGTHTERQQVDRCARAEVMRKDTSGPCHVQLIEEKKLLFDQLEEAKKTAADAVALLHQREASIEELTMKKRELTEELAALQVGIHHDHSRDGHQYDSTAKSMVANHVETLLAAIDRLRCERDNLKRDLEFLETESRITTETLRAQLANVLKEQNARSLDEDKVRHEHNRLSLAAASLAVLVNHLQGKSSTVEAELVKAKADSIIMSNRYAEDQKALEDRLLADSDQKLHNLETQLAEITQRFQLSENRCNDLLQLISDLESQSQSLACDVECSKSAHRQVQREFEQVEAQLVSMTQSFEAADSQRNTLCLQLADVQAELEAAQVQLSDAQRQYSSLQMQQLSAMSSTEMTQTLRRQIEELEGRVQRRTEQIGIHQHDIRRLETNLRLQEERIAEMTMELDTLGTEKKAMVEDCAEAREVRDELARKLETAELQMEGLEDHLKTLDNERSRELATLVAVVAETVNNSRANRTFVKERTAWRQQEELCRIEALGRENERVTERLGVLDDEFQLVIRELQDARSTLQDQADQVETQNSDLRQMTVAVAVSQLQFRDVLRALQASNQAELSLKTQCSSLEKQLNHSQDGACAFGVPLEPQQSCGSADISALPPIEDFQPRILELEAQLAELQSRYQKSLEDVEETNKQLQRRTAEGEMVQTAMENIRAKHQGEIQELQNELETHKEELRGFKIRYEDLQVEYQHAQAATLEAKQELANCHLSILEKSHTSADLERKLSQSQEEYTVALAALRLELSVAQEACRKSEESYAELQNLHERTAAQLARIDKDYQDRLIEANDRSETSQQDLASIESKLASVSAQYEARLEQITQESQETRQLLQTHIQQRSQDQEAHQLEMKTSAERLEYMESLQLELRQMLDATRKQLEQSEEEVASLQMEKHSLQSEISSLEGEIQRSISLTRYLESQVKESDENNASLTQLLERSKMELAQSVKSEKAAEMSLSLQAAHHEQAMSLLRRQLSALQSKPDLSAVVMELEEKNREMDELLKNRCAEIEDYDDRILEALKANKKLNAKVDSLTRKVQNLQQKLAASRDSPQRTLEDEANLPPAKAPVKNIVHPTPPLPPFQVDASIPRAFDSRAVSGPSSLSRPRTPEKRVMQTHNATDMADRPSLPESVPSSSAGKKRRAPDDERESIPTAGYYGDTARASEVPTTPRSRRNMHAPPTGFTPIRNSASRKMLGLSSPGKRAAVAVPKHHMSDVTNSPHSQMASESLKPSKKSWLGKIRGGATQKPPSARSSTFERPSDPQHF